MPPSPWPLVLGCSRCTPLFGPRPCGEVAGCEPEARSGWPGVDVPGQASDQRSDDPSLVRVVTGPKDGKAAGENARILGEQLGEAFRLAPQGLDVLCLLGGRR